MRYNKELFITSLAINTGVEKRVVRIVLDAVMAHVKACIRFNDTIVLRKFGTFYPRKSKRRDAREPYVVGFKASKERAV